LRFLLDENVPRSVERFLKARGLDVERVPPGINNAEVVRLAREKQRTLLTRDADFANVFTYPPSELPGIVVLKIHPPTRERLVEALERLLSGFQELRGRLFIVEEERVTVVEG